MMPKCFCTHNPVEALRLMYMDTIEYDPRVLRFVVEMMGADRIMLRPSMPFGLVATLFRIN